MTCIWLILGYTLPVAEESVVVNVSKSKGHENLAQVEATNSKGHLII
jgi:hypothetical protein